MTPAITKFEKLLQQYQKLFDKDIKHYENAIEESAGNSNNGLVEELHRQRGLNVQLMGYTEMMIKLIEDSKK